MKLRAARNEHTGAPVTVRAVHPSVAVADWYFAELDEVIGAMQADMWKHVLGAYGQIAPPEIAHDANPSLLIRAALRKWGAKWQKRFDKLSTDLSRKFARKSFTVTQTQLRAAFRDAGFTVKFQPTPGSAAAYQAVVAENVNLITSIPEQYIKDVESRVWNAVMHGGDLHELSVGLRKTYGITRERAALIARDQNAKAKAVIERARRQELGITRAVWIHSTGGKVPRATHVAMNGKPYDIAQGMYDSAEGRYVLPGELINCRCTSKAVIEAFETENATIRSATRRQSAARVAAARGRAR